MFFFLIKTISDGALMFKHIKVMWFVSYGTQNIRCWWRKLDANVIGIGTASWQLKGQIHLRKLAQNFIVRGRRYRSLLSWMASWEFFSKNNVPKEIKELVGTKWKSFLEKGKTNCLLFVRGGKCSTQSLYKWIPCQKTGAPLISDGKSYLLSFNYVIFGGLKVRHNWRRNYNRMVFH